MDTRVFFLVLFYLLPKFCFGIDTSTVVQLLLLESKINNEIDLLNVKFKLEKQERLRLENFVQKSITDVQSVLNMSGDGLGSQLSQFQVFETKIKTIQTQFLEERNASVERDRLVAILEQKIAEQGRQLEQQRKTTTVLSEEVQQLKSEATVQGEMVRQKDEEINRLQEQLNETQQDLRTMNATYEKSNGEVKSDECQTSLTYAFQQEKMLRSNLTTIVDSLATRTGILTLKEEHIETRLSRIETISESLIEFKDNISTVVGNYFDQTDEEIRLFERNLTEIFKFTDDIERAIDEVTNKCICKKKNVTDLKADVNKPRDCQKVLRADANAPSGLYTIHPRDLSSLQVYCDMTTIGGGWIVFQRRMDGSVDFNRDWTDYKNGFGKLDGEFWLGLETIHSLVSYGKWELLITLKSNSTGSKYALYERFNVGSEFSGYTLRVGKFTGDVNNSLAYHNGAKFTTRDRDNDETPGNCAVDRYKGGWWFRNCSDSRLNHSYGGDLWYGFRGPVEFVEMKMRKVI